LRRDGIVAEVHAVGAGRQGDVEAIVDDDARGRPACQTNEVDDKRRQLGVIETAFPDLNDVDARTHRLAALLDDRTHAAISDQTQRHRHVNGRWTSWPARDENTSSRSATPATTLTAPNPVTPPRTKLLVRNGVMAGHMNTK